MLTFVFLP